MKEILLFVVFNAALAGKIIGVSSAIYALLQGVKQVIPALKGWVAVVANVLLAVVGVIVVTPADAFFSLQTLTTVIVTALTAAGIHGTMNNVVLNKTP